MSGLKKWILALMTAMSLVGLATGCTNNDEENKEPNTEENQDAETDDNTTEDDSTEEGNEEEPAQ